MDKSHKKQGDMGIMIITMREFDKSHKKQGDRGILIITNRKKRKRLKMET